VGIRNGTVDACQLQLERPAQPSPIHTLIIQHGIPIPDPILGAGNRRYDFLF
jgi:hypothetical protein